MKDNFQNNFLDSLNTGFIDKNLVSEVLYRPKLLVNKKVPKEKVLSTILAELDNCESFLISVAFVTTSGIAVLMNSLLELEKRGIKGKVLVSQYLNFTQPEALKKLIRFKNIELKISTTSNAHSKGYIFKSKNYYNLVVGSSNLTASALCSNKEWNLKVSGLHCSEIVDSVLAEFQNDFKEATSVSAEYIDTYQEIYNKQRLLTKNNNIELSEGDYNKIKPNLMQKDALLNLKQIREEKKTKALIISATGTGKTYLSAFDVMAFKPKKMLFVVHRLNIAEKAKKTFQKLFKDKTCGIYSGNRRELDADFIFSTIQTISREEHLLGFEKDGFDYIIIDESHRSGAESYQRLINYFTPKFLLGMTATPERTDGNDIFSLFDHNIAYEIRLNSAMEEGMLSEFHYFGITDLSINNEEIENTKDFRLLCTDERVEKIIETANRYGCDNGITRGLVFCSRNEEAKNVSEKFNERGFKTIALSGENSEKERADAIRKLESNDINEKIDYIFTVDIFNEGIDIPKINQILMIRPTESAIIFVQQLGRGLRKSENKDFLTIVDFIGNHKNNYLIPIALYGDSSYNKDTLRKLISQGSKMLPGSSTINFDEISKEKIFNSIDSANLKTLSDLKKDYSLLKYRLGRVPMMVDFLKYQLRDPFLFVEYSRSYFNFVKKADKDFDINLNKSDSILLELFSKEINNSKRVEESFLLKELLKGAVNVDSFRKGIKDKYGYVISDQLIKSCIGNINFNFVRRDEQIISINSGVIKFRDEFKEVLKNDVFYDFFIDTIEFSISTFESKFSLDRYKNGLIVFNKYSRKDVCRLLNWKKDISSTVYGYRTHEKVTPCFVTYHKSDEIEASINYNDHFINPTTFAWESRSNRKLESNEIKNVIESDRILLFVKKEDAEGTDFYFMGDATIIKESIEQAVMPNSDTPIVHFKFKLEQPVEENLYNYLTQDKKSIDLSEVQDNIEEEKYTIPLYDFYAAAGSFSELQSEKSFTQIKVEERYATDDYFACKVMGESMNRRIENGSICIFKKNVIGSRSGKILLIENLDKQDIDFNSAFTIKTYISSKIVTEEGIRNQEIILRPNSFDSSYEDLIITEEDAVGMNIVGEFVKVLK